MEIKVGIFIYVQVEKIMCGLVKYGIILHMKLKKHLLPFGYAPAPVTPGLCKHKESGITLDIVVDKF